MSVPSRAQRNNADRVVTAVVLVVVAIAASALLWPHAGSRVARAPVARVQTIILANACRDFRCDVERYPRTLAELVDGTGIEKWDGPYLDPAMVPNDPWGRAYRCSPPASPGGPLDVFTLGADDRPGGTGVNRDFHSRRD